jgi:putative Ca2+/H+ antiporter (TMEM165/GDT1 family)
MELKLFATVFVTVFLAELGDKTQLATLLYATHAEHPKLLIFIASASALVVSAGIAVLAGSWISGHVSTRVLSWVAGIGFIAIGLWTILWAGA